MKTLPLRLLRQDGFTLIELMIVVGIIGILVAIAAPNFARYQSRARQSEAKIALSAIYAGEKSFYSEYSAYVASMDAIGYAPEGSKRFYLVGFGSTSGAISGYSGITTQQNYQRVNYPASWNDCVPVLTALTNGASGTDPQVFTSSASGQIRDGVNCDIWTITDTKLISNNTINL